MAYNLCTVGTILLLFVGPALGQPSIDDYLKQRKSILNTERSMKAGANTELNEDERFVNGVLMEAKAKEIEQAFKTDYFFPSKHFFNAKKDINKSTVFKILKDMPKGAALHLHDISLVDPSWIVREATYLSTCYMCVHITTKKLNFKQSDGPPPPMENCPWVNVVEARKASGDSQLFDQWLHNNMTMEVPNPYELYPNQGVLWRVFLEVLDTMGGAVFYRPLYKKFVYEALKQFYEDGVQYIENRCLLDGIYELDGTLLTREEALMLYKEVDEKFRQDYPDFTGSKIIQSALRFQDKETIGNLVNESIGFYQKYPDFYSGFDLVAREDPGHSLLYYLDVLLYPSKIGVNLPYFFHAGETNWQGEDVDNNLIDAILLNTSRIGHGYAVLKHSEAIRLIKEKNIAIEINPISNQVLGLVSDLRNHPASYYINNGVPIVISSDDPAAWGTLPMSHDFYEMFMGIAGAQADLGFLKKMAINSIQYSSLSPTKKKIAIAFWQTKWNAFIRRTKRKYHHKHNSTFPRGYPTSQTNNGEVEGSAVKGGVPQLLATFWVVLSTILFSASSFCMYY